MRFNLEKPRYTCKYAGKSISNDKLKGISFISMGWYLIHVNGVVKKRTISFDSTKTCYTICFKHDWKNLPFHKIMIKNTLLNYVKISLRIKKEQRFG